MVGSLLLGLIFAFCSFWVTTFASLCALQVPFLAWAPIADTTLCAATLYNVFASLWNGRKRCEHRFKNPVNQFPSGLSWGRNDWLGMAGLYPYKALVVSPLYVILSSITWWWHRIWCITFTEQLHPGLVTVLGWGLVNVTDEFLGIIRNVRGQSWWPSKILQEIVVFNEYIPCGLLGVSG